MSLKDSIGKVIVAFTQPSPNGAHATGMMVGYHDHPTAIIEDDNGEQFAWAMHLCRDATQDEEIEYWRNRARIAEGRTR